MKVVFGLWTGLLLLVMTGGNLPAQVARDVISLNRSWKFTPGWEVRHQIFTEVNLPHTWNTDALSGKTDYYRGLGNYEKSVEVPESWKGKKVFLRFKGVNAVANVFINGKHALEHRGGYTAFVVDLTGRVNYGKKNTILVRVNNAIQLDVMPLVGDFNMYGGIYRDVDLIVTGPEHISLSDYASSGVYLLQEQVSGEKATVKAKVILEGRPGENAVLCIQVKEHSGKVVVEKSKDIVFDGKGLKIAELNLEISKPHLWNGRKDPYCYTAEAVVLKDGKEADRVTEPLGLRYFRIDPEQGFFLNGEHLKLRGVCRHQDHAETGNALSPQNHEEDMDIMLEMGVNAIRLAHYPQDKYMYDLCDRNGLVVWAEIPFIGPGGYRDKGFVDQSSFRENGKQQLVELIRQNFNHPSICFWGLFNELKQAGDDPCEYVRELNVLAHREDPSRPTTAASNQGGELNELTDLICWNQYFGWYGGEPGHIGSWADRAHKTYPERCIGISEYGAGASIYHQQPELKKPVANSYWHPENWQAYYHEEHWKAIASRPFLWGTFVWNMFDFGAAHRTEGEIAGKNDKGLVTFDRRHKKDAFYFYKANWNTGEPFVYIASRRLKERTSGQQTVKVYSNQPEVELFLDGKSLGKRKTNYGICVWENVNIRLGQNKLTAKAKAKVWDEIELTGLK